MLAAPQFLFLKPNINPSEDAGSALPDNDFAIASRLSYFLWTSTPDEELLRLASQGRLRSRRVLRAQVKRMLMDGRSRALSEDFAPQWLQTRTLRDFTPDPILFPDFDESLRSAMAEETRRFFMAIQDEDRNVTEFLDAGFTFVNERLGATMAFQASLVRSFAGSRLPAPTVAEF